MPAYRGMHRDGVVIGPAILQDWKETPPKQIWKIPVGGGYASVAIRGDLLVTIEQRGENEAITCYDNRTGEMHWEYSYPASFFEAMGGAGPRSTPTISQDAVFAFGAFGDLCCLDLKTGKLNWHVNALQQFNVPNTSWGMSCSPLIDQDRVIVNIGGLSGNGLVAYHTVTGEVIWKTDGLPQPRAISEAQRTGINAVPDSSEKSCPGYASPQISTIAGQELILNLDGKALRGHDPQTGVVLWSTPFENLSHVNVAQPIVFPDGRVFISTSYNVGCKMIRVTKENDAWEVEELWSNRNMRCKFTSAVLVNGLIYGLDEGILVCLDPETGKRLWKGGKTGLKGRYNHGQILVTNGQILAQSEQGMLVLIEPNAEKLVEKSSLQILPIGKNWNPLVLCRGMLYARNASEMVCFRLLPDSAHQQNEQTPPPATENTTAFNRN
ncbi:PQQ-binding-like beta-propeller repeat protein [Planctomicrobium sp. SH668]|uniref:PQQ-binding-like beta-propeller repeat protein n=1 Tax=Planctomicrobium sp. SH668 TaxID=3448126 RepID=UPI003F5C3E72